MVADEIEKIKGFFYTKFKHDSHYPDLLGKNKYTVTEFQKDLAVLFWQNPQTAFAYSQRLKSEVTNPKSDMLSFTFGPLIEPSMDVFIKFKEFLPFFIDYRVENGTAAHGLEGIMYWEMPFIPDILKYIGQKYDQLSILGNFFAKMMLRINSSQLSFYLSQIFQSLDYNTAEIIESFIINYSESSPLFAHQVIWMARVEEKADTEGELSQNQRKRTVAGGLPMKIIKNMGIQEKKFWDEVDSFYEQVTKISSALHAKMPKLEKIEIIKEHLMNINMPPLVYMPTNPDYRVTRIKTDSGRPMQSAAKCPILVSFYCRKFEGPDKYFSALKNKKDEHTLLESGFRDIDENVGQDIPDKLCSRSISIKDNAIMRNGIHYDLHNSSNYESYTKLNHITEEIFPIFTSQKKNPITSSPGSPEIGPRVAVQNRLTAGVLPDRYMFDGAATKMNSLSPSPAQQQTPPLKSVAKKEDTEEEDLISCIFKTHDDIRRDNLSLQIIRIFQEIFEIEKLDLYLFPYKTISSRTGNVKIDNLRIKPSEVSSRWSLGQLLETKSVKRTSMTYTSTSRTSTAAKYQPCSRKRGRTSSRAWQHIQ